MKGTERERPGSVDEYIAMFPPDIQEKLQSIRDVIKGSAPDAEESLGYNMPAYKFHGPLVYFAAFKNHIGFYPTPSGMTEFEEEMSSYKHGKGSIQFPLAEPIPLDLIRKIVQFRVKENLEK